MTIQEQKTLEEAILVYGTDAQIKMLIEECAELIQAINKYDRAKELGLIQKRHYELSEEIADVEIMLLQAKIILNNKDLVEDIKSQKIQRLSQNLANDTK